MTAIHGYPPYPEKTVQLELEPDDFSVEGVRLTLPEAFNPVVRHWIDSEMANDVWYRFGIRSELRKAKFLPEEVKLGELEFVWQLCFVTLADATMFKLRWVG